MKKKYKLNKINKKAQVASAITWVVAFLIIFFIMLTFVVFATQMVGRKKLSSGDSSINLENDQFSSSTIQRALITFLSTQQDNSELPVDKMTFKELLLNFNKDFYEKQVPIPSLKTNDVYDNEWRFYYGSASFLEPRYGKFLVCMDFINEKEEKYTYVITSKEPLSGASCGETNNKEQASLYFKTDNGLIKIKLLLDSLGERYEP